MEVRHEHGPPQVENGHATLLQNGKQVAQLVLKMNISLKHEERGIPLRQSRMLSETVPRCIRMRGTAHVVQIRLDGAQKRGPALGAGPLPWRKRPQSASGVLVSHGLDPQYNRRSGA